MRYTSLAVTLWLATGCQSPVAAADSHRPELAAGKKVYVAKCGKCHKFYNPARYSEADWETWMGKMARKSKLTPQQDQDVRRYVQEALRPAPPSSIR